MSDIPQVGPVDPKKETSEIAEGKSEKELEQEAGASTLCVYNDKTYSWGAVICAEGDKLRCGGGGKWWKIGSC